MEKKKFLEVIFSDYIVKSSPDDMYILQILS